MQHKKCLQLKLTIKIRRWQVSKEYVLKNLDKQIAIAKRYRIMKGIVCRIYELKPNAKIFFNEWSGNLVFRINSIDELKEVRKILRKIFYRWEDKIETIWHSSGLGLASYINRKNKYIQIRLETPIESFPVLKEGCGFKKVQKTEERYNYVCDLGENK
jgi:hypothetical protein